MCHQVEWDAHGYTKWVGMWLDGNDDCYFVDKQERFLSMREGVTDAIKASTAKNRPYGLGGDDPCRHWSIPARDPISGYRHSNDLVVRHCSSIGHHPFLRERCRWMRASGELSDSFGEVNHISSKHSLQYFCLWGARVCPLLPYSSS